MKAGGIQLLFVGAAMLVGCSAARDSAGGYTPGRDAAPWSGAGGAMAGSGGSTGMKSDAASPANADAGAGVIGDGNHETLPSSFSGDAASFNWDTHTCTGCGETGGSSGTETGGRTGTAGVSGSGGTAGSSAKGGSVGAGGRTAAGTGGAYFSGGNSGTAGGATGKGGAGGATGGGRDGGAGGPDLPPALDAGRAADSASDASVPVGGSGGGGYDVRPTDAFETSSACTAQIEPVVPASSALNRLIAGADARVVLRAQVVSGTLPAGASWSWQASWEGSPLSPVALGQQDPAAAAFAVANPGSYTFKALAGPCQATLSGFAVAADICGPCDSSVVVRAASPAATSIPVQGGAMKLRGPSPFVQDQIVLMHGVPILVTPSLGSTQISAYVRINDLSGGLVVDGLADTRTRGFASQVLAVDNNRVALQYDVLVVPVDGSDGQTTATTAPQLYQALSPSSINGSFPLTGGVTVTGAVASATGPLSDVRVMLTNQDPAAAQQKANLLFSSVGRSDAQGNYTLHVQKGAYWASFSPPSGVGLAEAVATTAITISGDASLAFQWEAPTTATLSLTVLDSAGVAVPGATVRVSSFQSRSVGTLTLTQTGAGIRQAASGRVQIESTTDSSGGVVFPGLPANAAYDLLLVPAIPGPHAATTTASVRLDAAGTPATVQLLQQAILSGRLLARGPSALDLATVKVLAYDRSVDSPEAPKATVADGGGNFAFGVTPGRPYVLLAVPDAGSGYARTFVGPGPVYASEFVITQTLLGSMVWSNVVMDERQYSLPDTALQVFCDLSWPSCVDPTIPLAETTSDANGSFDLFLQDPSTR